MSAAKPATATPASVSGKPIAINMPKVGGSGGKVLGVMKNVTPQVTGEAVSNTLETLDKVGLKDNIETKIKSHDHETEEEIKEEGKRITRRIYRINLFITYMLFYTALMMQWLTLLGLSTSVGSFFYQFFIHSFVFSDYDFSSLATVGKIAGFTASLQIILFVLSNVFVVITTLRNKTDKKETQTDQSRDLNSNSNGGKFKFINDLKPVLSAHFLEVKKIDSQVNQILGIVSQLFIIVAASLAADDKLSSIDGYTNDNSIDPSNFPSAIMRRQEVAANNSDILRVKHAALFAKTVTIIAVLAIIMTSFLNMVAWMADIWEVNRNELIIFKLFSAITRLMVCYSCCGDKLSGADEEIDEKTQEQEDTALSNQANKKPQSAEKLLNDAQQNSLKNPKMNDLMKKTLSGPNQDDIEKISGEQKNKNDKEKQDLSTLAKDGVDKIVGGDKKNSQAISLVKNGIDIVKKVSDSANSGEGGKPNVEKLVTDDVQDVVTATGADKNPSVNLVSQGVKILAESEDGNPNVEKLVTDGVQAAVTATGADKNPVVDVASQEIKNLTESGKSNNDA